ncbi:MAG: DUF481 domain-containing protein [Planctomycetota bacterium]
MTIRSRTAQAGLAICVSTLAMNATALGEEFNLVSGDRISGTVIETTADHIVIDHAAMGRVELPKDQIMAGMSSERQSHYYDTALAAMQDIEAAEKEWKSYIDIGGGATFGNSDTQNANVAFQTVRENDATRTTIDAKYFYGASDGDRDENRFTAGILQDWFVPDSPWLYFATARYDFDEFNSWDYRISAHGGVGYELIVEEDRDLTLRAGLGASREFNSPDDDIRFEGLLGADFNWQISERQSFHFDTTIYPQLDEFGEFRTLSNANWAVLIDEETSLSLTAGVQHEYQSEVDGDTDENDFRVTVGLRYDF